MRIAIDARELTGRPTGVGRYLNQLLLAWANLPAAAAHDFVLCAAEPIEITHTGPLRVSSLVERGHGTVWEQTMLPRLVRDARADVLFAPGYTAPLLSPAPTVVAIHDVSFCAHPEWFSWREGMRRRMLTRLSARRATRILTISGFSRREIVTHLGADPGKVEVIYPGTTQFGAGGLKVAPTQDSDPMVLYVGSLFERRHIPQLIAGFARFAHQHRGATLEIVGDSRTQPPIDVAGLAAAAGVAGHVHARSYVSDAELAALYGRAAAFAFLSDYEGFGLTPLEALASGVPPVVLDTEVAREIYGPAAVYVAGPNPALIATALETAVTDGAERRQVLAAAPQVLARYSWDECAHRTLHALLASA